MYFLQIKISKLVPVHRYLDWGFELQEWLSPLFLNMYKYERKWNTIVSGILLYFSVLTIVYICYSNNIPTSAIYSVEFRSRCGTTFCSYSNYILSRGTVCVSFIKGRYTAIVCIN